MSRRSSDSQDTVVNSEEINYPKIQNDLDDWKLPKVSNQEIYKKGTFKFFTDYTIKTSEMTVSLEQDDQVIRLLDNRSVEKHKKDGYNFIHFGMIQVAAKPLTRLVRLRDADILDSVVLHIKTHDFKIKPGNNPVSIITRFAYKSMNTSVGSGALCTSPKGETTYFHSDMLDKSDFIIPKKILWKDVDFPKNWHFANAVPAIAQRSESIEQIVQYPDGGGELVFSKSFRHSSSPRVSVYEPSRASSSSIPVRTTRKEEGSSSGNPKNVKLTGVRSYTNVARPFYSEENESTQESQQDESPVMSPTYSQMINTISLSDEDFEINKDLLRKDFYSEVNKQRNDWFFSTIPKVIRTIYQEEFYAYLRQEKKNIYDNIIIESIHPPEAKIEKNINGTIVTALPFKTKPEDKGTASASDIRRIMEQINYTNMFLITLGNQVNRVEEIIEIQDHLKKPFVKNDNKPLFKPFELSKKFQENPQIDQAFIDKISQKVKDNLVIPETPQPSHRRILLVKRNISPKAKDNGLIRLTREPSIQNPFKEHEDKQEKKIILNALTIKDLQEEIGQYKKDIENLRQPTSSEIPIPQDYINRVGFYHSSTRKEDFEEVLESSQDNSDKINAYLNTISAALNCLQEGLVPTQFYEKTRQALFGANGKKLIIKYKLSNAHICNQGICIKQTFILVKDLKEKVLLGVPFLSSIFPMKQHEVELPYEPDFSEKNIPTKARPIQMNKDLLSYCEKEIQDLMDKKLIRKSKSPWSCSAFYVQKQAELERGTPRLVINYKPLNDVLRWIRLQKKIDSVEQHWKHLNRFIETVKSNGLSLSATKINLFQTKVRFLGHHIHQGTFTPIQRSIEFADKFPDEIKDKKQLQRFLGSLNYVSDFIQDLSQLCAPLRQRLKKNPVPWNEDHTKIVKIVKSRVKTLPCLALADHKAFKIVETDASDIGFGGILKQRSNNQELIHKTMAPKTEKQSFKKSSSYMKPHSVLSEKFKPLYYDFTSRSQGSTSDPNPPILKHPSSPVVEEGNISGSLPLVEEPIPLNLSTFDTNPLSVHKSICDLQTRSCTEPLLHQQDNKPICNCNRNFTISRACIDLQYYQPISLAFNGEVLILTPEKLLDYGLVYQLICSDPSQASNFGRKVNLSLTQGFKLNKKFDDAIFISKAPEWISRGNVIPAQHYVNIHYQNRRPTLRSSPLVQSDICGEPIIKQIKHWRARVISRDFEAYPKNMGHLIAADSLH
ncbi:Enzymatic polyprotein [Vitis vinifera]|uniref:Enzymatic polyprotein n=1 Tax=Vitis vinifera TaxID=29760 RepID=A0A438CN01_VITVI|nr:Enzymatic polyprotein [Vitis vinifera]